jgi:Dehydratase medium subunit
LCEGIAAEGLTARVVKFHHTADCGALGHEGAKLSGSGIAIGLQSKGTTVIQRKGLAPLNNLELFAMAPLLTKEAYCQIGSNAARHARGKPSSPVAVKVDNMARLRLIVQATLMHKREIAAIELDRPPSDVEVRFDGR